MRKKLQDRVDEDTMPHGREKRAISPVKMKRIEAEQEAKWTREERLRKLEVQKPDNTRTKKR